MSLLPPVLLIDESADDRELLSLVLTGAFGEVEVEEVSEAAALARAVTTGRFGVVLTEHELSWIKSKDVLRLIRDLHPGCPVIVVTGLPIEKVASEILHLSPDGLVPKTSTGLAGLPRVIRSALYHVRRRSDEENRDAPHRRLLDALPVGVFVASEEGTLLDVNPALAAILGYARPEECVQRPLAGLFVARAEAEAFRAGLAPGVGMNPVEARLRRADGDAIWVRISAWRAAPVGDGEAQLQGMVEDRTSARAADEALSERSAALARSNSELDEMAYVVSHDLRKPLTQIARFLDLLEEESGTRLGRDARSVLEQARQSAGRLEGMVDAVLRCARIESRGEAFAAVDLEALLERVLERLAPDLGAAGAEVEHEDLPTVRGDESQIEQLFQNLIENGLKFRGKAAPRLTVAADDEGEAWHLRFRDNGIGIDPKDAERIFVIFQRLHTESEIPGSGIGLAICRRIVARHGGRIWVESKPSEGATFHVMLPKHPPAAAGSRGGG